MASRPIDKPVIGEPIRRSTLPIRVLATAATLIVLGVVGLAVWMIVDSRRAAWNSAVQVQDNLLIALEGGICRNIELHDLSLRALADGLKLPDIGSVSPEIRRHVLFDGGVSAPDLGAMVATDEQGKVVVSSIPDPTGATDLSDRDYFRAHRDHRELGLLVTGPLRSRLTDSWALALSRRLEHPDGSFAGVVVGTMKLTLFRQVFEAIDLGGGRVGLIHADGHLILRQPFHEKDIGRDLRAGKLLERITTSRSGHYEGDSVLDHGRYLFSYRRVGDLPLFLVLRKPVESVFAEWRQKAIAVGVGLSGLAALAGILAFALITELRRRSRAEAAALAGEHGLVLAKEQAERARAEAEAASRVKSEFLATMSHELRTPLNAIIGFSEVLRDALMAPLDQRYRDYARDIHDSGLHLLRLINDVLDLSKIEVGRLELQEEAVDLGALLADSRRLIAERAGKAQVEVTVDTAPELPQVRADELRLKQIVLNLLSNAVKFTPAGGKVRVSAQLRPHGGVAIVVADSGIGMKPEEIPQALEPFRQLDSRLARRFEGTGLGLPLAKTLTELHGGRLMIENSPGRGTIATIELPAERSLLSPRAA